MFTISKSTLTNQKGEPKRQFDVREGNVGKYPYYSEHVLE